MFTRHMPIAIICIFVSGVFYAKAADLSSSQNDENGDDMSLSICNEFDAAPAANSEADKYQREGFKCRAEWVSTVLRSRICDESESCRDPKFLDEADNVQGHLIQDYLFKNRSAILVSITTISQSDRQDRKQFMTAYLYPSPNLDVGVTASLPASTSISGQVENEARIGGEVEISVRTSDVVTSATGAGACANTQIGAVGNNPCEGDPNTKEPDVVARNVVRLLPDRNDDSEKLRTAAEFGLEKAISKINENSWLLDKERAYIDIPTLSTVLGEENAVKIIMDSLNDPTLSKNRDFLSWPPVDIGGKRIVNATHRTKRYHIAQIAKMRLPDWMIWFRRLLDIGEGFIDVYISSNPDGANIVHRKYGKSYGHTGIYLTVRKETLRELRLEKSGYRPCFIPFLVFDNDNIVNCELKRIATRNAP